MKLNDQKLRTLIILLFALFWLPCHTVRAQEPAENLVLVTLDGVRWQEIFGGIDLRLIEDERYTDTPDSLKQRYWDEQRSVRRERLFPFLSSVIANEGVLVGDREQGSNMEVSNLWWFSYPGYNEILTGQADPAIDSNDKNWNSNVTFLEVLNNREGFKNRVLAFGSWDVFPYIINTQRSRVPVNIGSDASASQTVTGAGEQIRWLDAIAAQAPRLWATVRLDFLTHGYAMLALESQHPRVTYIAYGETDDFAHDESYDRYIDAAHRSDQMLADLWSQLQSDPFYRDHTTLIITTDHGRGNTADGWPHHAGAAATARLKIEEAPDGIVGSNQIWLAAIGPRIRSTGLIKGEWKQSQIAATALATLRLDPDKLMPEADKAMAELLRPPPVAALDGERSTR
jgi:hypothetical protein